MYRGRNYDQNIPFHVYFTKKFVILDWPYEPKNKNNKYTHTQFHTKKFCGTQKFFSPQVSWTSAQTDCHVYSTYAKLWFWTGPSYRPLFKKEWNYEKHHITLGPFWVAFSQDLALEP